MNEDVKTKWLTALRTGLIGDQPVVQQKNELRGPDLDDGTAQMCCLGVLTEIAIAEGVEVVREESTPSSFEYKYRDEDADDGWAYEYSEELPPPVAEWAGLGTMTNPIIKSYEVSVGKPFLSAINDDTEEGFEGIADLIEKYL